MGLGIARVPAAAPLLLGILRRIAYAGDHGARPAEG
jgi:hypothetical protein